jgi:hypothetical protein
VPRIRNIKPEFFLHDRLAECSPLARLLFIGTWTQADRNGVLKGHAKRLKAIVLPWDECDVDALIGELESRGFIQRYESEGEPYIYLPTFRKHQTFSGSEPTGKLPLPTNAPATAPQPSSNGLGHDHQLLKPVDEKRAQKKARKPNRSDSDDPDGFAQFYAIYPRKVNRPAAVKAWKKLNPDAVMQATILVDVAARAKSPEWLKNNGEFIGHPASYLNGRRWEDQDSPVRNGADRNGTADDEVRHRFAEGKRIKDELLAGGNE